MERIRRAAKKIAEENPLFHGDIGFKHYTLEDFDDNTIDRLYDFDPNAIINSDDLLTTFGATFPEGTTGKGSTRHTYIDYENLLYDLNAYDAFRLNLIKGVAMADELEKPAHSRERFTIGY